jgi:hypothetical protein
VVILPRVVATGDSGGPVFTINGASAGAAGMISAAIFSNIGGYTVTCPSYASSYQCSSVALVVDIPSQLAAHHLELTGF